MTTDERVLRLENALSTLVELARTQSERMDEYERRTEEMAQSQTDLAQAQTGLTQAQTGLTQAQTELTEAQKQTEANLSALLVIVSDLGRAQLRTERTLEKLSEKVDRFIGGS
jgi:hypothetical protein